MNDQLRKGYKLTEVGMIPEDWEVKRLGEIGEALIGLTYKPEDISNNGILVLRSSNIKEYSINFEDNVFVEKVIPNRIMVRSGDILICVRNGSRDLIGKSVLLDERTTGMTFGAFMAVLRSQSGQFINYLFQCEVLKKQINEHLGATINQITNKSLNSFYIPLPPTKEEQTAIATVLSDSDRLIESLDRLIAKKRNLKQATMQQLLTGKTRLAGFSGEWEVKRLGDVAERIIGGGTPSRSNTSFWDGEIPWITVKDFASFNPYCSQEYITEEGLKNSSSNLIPKGTVITSTRMALGKAVIYAVDVSINQDLKAIIPKQTLDSLYLYYWFQSKSLCIDGLGSGSTVKGILLQDLKKLEFTLPSLPEQTAITTILSDMDKEIAALEQRRDKNRALKQGMMQELLMGRIRLI